MNLERLRIETGLTQEEFWGRIGISQSGGSRYEGGRIVPEPVRLLLSIAYGSKREREMVLRALLPKGADGSDLPAVNRQAQAEGGAASRPSSSPPSRRERGP